MITGVMTMSECGVMRSGIVVECDSCHQAGRCNDMPAMQRESLFAWGRKESTPSCPDHVPRYHHGIDGVYAHPSPRPSQRRGIASIDHRRSSC